MKITLKNLQQQTFTIEFQPEKKVIELKQKIFSERGPEYVIEKQKLIYAGVILEDERSISSYNVDEKKFVVVMLKRDIGMVPQKSNEIAAAVSNVIGSGSHDKGKVHEGKKQTNTAGATTSEDGKIDGVSKDKNSNLRLESAGTSSATSNNAAENPLMPSVGENPNLSNIRSSCHTPSSCVNTTEQSVAESHLLMGEEYWRYINMITEMGYSRDMVERSMAASFNNPERAVEYLISGIPDGEDGFNASTTIGPESVIPHRGDASNVTVSAEYGNRETTRISGVGADSMSFDTTINRNAERDSNAVSALDDPFEFLRNQPQFLQMRSLVYQNPDLLHAVLQQIGQTNPALLQLISENQDAFLSMLNQPMDGQADNSQRRYSPGRHAQLAAATQAASIIGTDGRRALVTDIPIGSASDRLSRNHRAAQATSDDVGDANMQGTDNVSVLRDGSGGTESQTVATIRLTPQDQIAIERLKALGFPEALVLQAYFACEKDEQLAANFLISSAFDD